MKLSFKDLPIRLKIMFIVLLVVLTTISITVYTYLSYEKRVFLKNAENELMTISKIIAENNLAALLFKDNIQSEIILKTLKNDPNIIYSCIFDNEKNIFAWYINQIYEENPVLPVSFTKNVNTNISNNYMTVLLPILDIDDNNLIIGYIFIARTLKEFNDKMYQFLILSLVMVFFILILSYLLTNQLQKLITNPIVKLSDLTNTISETKNYNLRLPHLGNDETGTLVKGFNHMLETIAEQNNQLVKAKEEASKNAKAKEEFLANISHEIRTPLNAITGFSNILIDTSLNAEQRLFIQNIKSASDNLLSIVNDILDYSKIGAHKLEFEKIEFNINEVINDVIQSLSFHKNIENIKLKANIDLDIPLNVLGDRIRLYQILLNLTSNAVKFTEKGEVSINLKLKKQSNLTYHYLFSIQDTGIGIPKNKQSIIFESFRQASSDTVRKYGGTGLGLAITKQLVELQGGKIWVKSEPEKGSTFYFTMIYNSVSANSETINNTEKYEYNTDCLSKINVLLVEDNQMNATLVVSLLKKQKVLNVDIAPDGKKALQLIKKNNYNIVLLDINLPDMNGIDVAKYIRSEMLGYKQSIPIIAFTATVNFSEQERFIKEGINDFIPKPFKPEMLFSKICKLYQK